MRTLKKIIELLLGRKYYIVVVNRYGTSVYEVASFMFTSKKEVEEYKRSLYSNRTYMYVETRSFRSRYEYNDPEEKQK